MNDSALYKMTLGRTNDHDRTARAPRLDRKDQAYATIVMALA